MKAFKKYLPLLLIIAASVTVWLAGLDHYFNFYTLRTYQQELQSFIAKYFTFSVLIYSALYITVVSLSIPVATFMTLLGGFLFGQILGTVTVVISATIGAIILFLAVRYASESFIARKTGTWVQKMRKGFQENALY